MNRRIYIFFVTIVVSAVLAACKGGGDEPAPGPENETPKPVTEVAFARGADISWASEMEHEGISFQDGKGAGDIFTVLKNLGMNSIRLRVWVDPYDENGWSGQRDVVDMSKRAMEAGMAIMVDFHYSDIFADPGKQIIPGAWSSYSKDPAKAASALASHTTSVLNALKTAGVVPAWVQVGNETNNGMVWDAGRIDWDKSGSARYADYVTLSNAGYDAVKKVFPSTPVIVHIANAFSAAEHDGWFFREFKEAGGKFDMIGLSHYPMGESGKTWSEMNALAVSSIKSLAAKFSCKVMVCEVGVRQADPSAGSAMGSFMSSAKGLGKEVCAGVFYWEPEVDVNWRPAIYGKPGLVCSGWGGYENGAFSSSGKIFKPITSILGAFAE